MNSFESGVIYPASLGQDLSRNSFVVSVYALGKNLYRGIGFCMTPQKSSFSRPIALAAIRVLVDLNREQKCLGFS